MPDISMCMHPDCTLRRNCYRHGASGTKASEVRQAYTVFEPDDNGNCDSYWPFHDADRWPLVDIEEPDHA